MAIEVKFCIAKRTYMSVGPAKFDMNRYNESPLRGEKPDFWPVNKFNTGSLPLRGLISEHVHRQLAHCNPLFHFLNVLVPTGFVLVGQ